MTNNINIALIKCANNEEHHDIHKNISISGYSVLKMFATENTSVTSWQSIYPEAELVKKKEGIIQDNDIELVIICKPGTHDKLLISEVVRSGKKVQIL
jgi:hypothetical protein